MTEQDRMSALFFELFTGLPRQGPGDDASTLKALGLTPPIGRGASVLDIGCGTGRQTLTLARHCPARFIGVDSHGPYVEAATVAGRREGLGERVEFRLGDMARLEFPDASFNLLWCEGAIYAIGFECGLREWRRLLKPGGCLAVTEACWMKPDPPAEPAAFWAAEYPAIRTVDALLDVVSADGWETLAHFPLPSGSWWTDYYGPLQENVERFRRRHEQEPDAQELADRVAHEIDMWRRYSDYYGYEFVIMRPNER